MTAKFVSVGCLFWVLQLGRCLFGMLSGLFWKGKEKAEREGRERGYWKSLRGMKGKGALAFHFFERQLSGEK